MDDWLILVLASMAFVVAVMAVMSWSVSRQKAPSTSVTYHDASGGGVVFQGYTKEEVLQLLQGPIRDPEFGEIVKRNFAPEE